MRNISTLLHYLTVVVSLSAANSVLAQDGQHDHQDHLRQDHGAAQTILPADTAHQSHTEAVQPETPVTTMDHSAHTMVDGSALRDPHAYSGGYTRTTGPYVLAGGSAMHMADDMTFTGLWMDRLERVRHEDGNATELEGRFWRGNSYDKFVINTEAEFVGNSLQRAEIDFLWSHAVTPFWNLRLGLTQEIGDAPDRSWATFSFRGLAPYWLDLETNIHIGEGGRTAFELEAEYDLLLTQRLVVQPRLDFKAYGKSDMAAGRGKGVANVEAGVRLRYEFSRQFAPYLGVERAAVFGETAKLLPAGEPDRETHWVAGFRFWF